ncbi:MAG: lipoyl(octanoyl) transferase LipB [Actinomycetes bacterium]
MSALTFSHLPGTVDYLQGLGLQRELHQRRVEQLIEDTVLLLEHAPVYTAGRRTQDFERPMDGTPVIDTDRGGRITWHGPGQLVGYPIVALPMPLDLVAYVRKLEAALIQACEQVGLVTGQVEGRTGIWVEPNSPNARKIAAIGVRVAKGVTMHGFALNCDNSLAGFSQIVACGITDAKVSTISAELGQKVGINDLLEPVKQAMIYQFA